MNVVCTDLNTVKMNKSSKRKSSDAIGINSKRSRASDEEYRDDSVFCRFLVKCGFILKTRNHRNALNVDQAVFQRDLRTELKQSSYQTQTADKFIDGFQKYLEESDRFHKSLLPTETSPDCDTSIRGGNQECLIRLLLGIDAIQPQLMKILLEKLPEFMGDDDCIFDQGETINVPRLILSQFRWLDRVVDSKELISKMLEIIPITSLDIQREIITCIPEVVDDDQHADVAKSLSDLLLSQSSLTVPILDALSNLCLYPELLAEVRNSVIQTLTSVEMQDLPVVTKFLLQSISGSEAVEVIEKIRTNLDLQSYDLPISTVTSSKKSSSKNESSRCSVSLTLDAIKSAIRFQKRIAEAWIKVSSGLNKVISEECTWLPIGDQYLQSVPPKYLVKIVNQLTALILSRKQTIDSVREPSCLTVVDIFVLLILHSTNRKKTVESLFRNKIRASCLTDAILQDAFLTHAQVLRDYFSSILSLSEVLLRSPELGISRLACSIYKLSFANFDTFCKQEIVGNLVTHIGSGCEGEIDSALDILADLVSKHLKTMAPFAVFVKGVLDYLDNLKVVQIRKLYSVLSELAFRNPKDGGLIQDDLHIIVRKQLSNNDQKYKRMGVIAAVMIIKSMAFVNNHDNADTGESTLTEDVFKQICNLLQLVKTSVSKSPEAMSLFMDELSSVVQCNNLHKKVEDWIGENVINDFQEDFVTDIDSEAVKQQLLVPMEKLYGLDDEAEGNIAINLLPLIVKSYETKKQQKPASERIPSPVCLAAHFRLVRICEQRQQSDLEGIDALLGCPVYCCQIQLLEKMGSLSVKEKDVICNTLFQTINWFREVVNGFASQDQPEMKGKVITRLQNITELQKHLEISLKAHPTFQPPMAVFDWEDSVTKAPTPANNPGTSRKPGRKAGKKKKVNLDETNDITIDEDNADATVLTDKDASQLDSQAEEKDKGDGHKDVSIDLNQYRPFFRELDLDVFRILNAGFITKAALDTEMNTKSVTDVQIQPPQLAFLLEDLSRKFNHSLVKSASKRRTFFKTKGDKNIGFSHLEQFTAEAVAKKGVKLLPTLCQHLEAASAFFQTLIEDNDGMVDGPGSSTPEAKTMATCFNLLLQCLLSLFSWNGFTLKDNRALLHQVLSILGSRIASSRASQPSLSDLFKTAFGYVEKFSSAIPDLDTAVTLLKLLICLSDKRMCEQMHETIASHSEQFLKREWLGEDGERLRGAKHNEHLHMVIKTYLIYSEDPLTAAEQITTIGVPELLDADKNGCSKTFPSLDRPAFAVFYKVMLSELVTSTKDLQPVKKEDELQVKLDSLIQWNLAVRIFHVLISLIKAFDTRSNIGTALKYGRQFVDVFLRQGMPTLDHMFRGHRDDVQGLLKNLQFSTRTMHHICGHSKIVRDVSLTNQVPMVKRTLEMFVYRVRAMLTLNKCLEAFWMGNLKNRDLQGAEILSQSTVASSPEEEDGSDPEQETLPEEDEDSDVEVEKQSEEGNGTKNGDETNTDNELSYSAVF